MVVPVGVLLIIILAAAILTGSLWGVLEIAAGVAVGLFLFVAAIAVAGWFLVRRKMRDVHREIERYRRGGY
jgi:membrane protein implicated in regulation of membrane protease activity